MATYLVIILQTITDDLDQSASHRNASREMNWSRIGRNWLLFNRNLYVGGSRKVV